ncbi:hypothetical protein Kuja_1240 [Vibrio phage vB_VchM_Kuja]|uniref:Uncharacterized protein n=1 Tax=Vibrio phage vB_VchM_Kuja TaxID=2686437 RepID=A0A6B9J5J3_9CAUD|nr:hypothetical protein HWC83_gp112 [Vibrio phage vB_VchM_Kuja]QGZ16115.1 hypothetical protein Kuja_1240 [Vibrio phage vB_VchM_Kuja]
MKSEIFDKTLKSVSQEIDKHLISVFSDIKNNKLSDTHLLRLISLSNALSNTRLGIETQESEFIQARILKLTRKVHTLMDMSARDAYIRNLGRSLMKTLLNDHCIKLISEDIVTSLDLLLDRREFLTRISDQSKVDKELQGVLFCGFSSGSGLCAYFVNYGGMTEFQKKAASILMHSFCDSLDVDHGYPICIDCAEYSEEKASEQYGNNRVKWVSDPYGQACWAFTEGLRKFILEKYK